MSATEPPAKRRKKQKDPFALSIGGKEISLKDFLDPEPKAKPPTAAIESTPETTVHPQKWPEESVQRRKRPYINGEKEFKVRSKEHAGLLQSRKALPIWQHRREIEEALQPADRHVMILVGETGSGKSTQVPQFLSQEPWCRRQHVKTLGSKDTIAVGGLIAITQPRRVAATTLAHRVSREAGTPLGKGRTDGLVGYSVRFDHQVPRGTKIKFLTEGMLLQELLCDPFLRQYSAVIVDEIHERSLDADLLIGSLKQILAGDLAGRGGIPLKVVLMSATADIQTLQDIFRSLRDDPDIGHDRMQVLRIKGRQYPVDVVHEQQPVPDIQDALLKKIFKIHVEEPLPGDILAFLTGQEEIETAQSLIEEYAGTLASNVPKVKVCPLYGQLSMEAQRGAFAPVRAPLTRKIVLATNIAETSVTVPGVRFVVDNGKAKVKRFRPQLGMESLLAQVISKSSALQRTGRAGREGRGKCFRLYTEADFEKLRETDLPEILRTDILGAILTVKARGIHDVLAFPLIDKPDRDSIMKALLHLHFLGALTDYGVVTSAGKMMARFPIPVPFSAVILAAAERDFDCLVEVIDIISCVTAGDDIFLRLQSEEAQEEFGEARKELQRREGDLITYLTTMQRYAAENSDRTSWCMQRRINMRTMRQALNIRSQLRGLCLKEKLLVDTPPPDPQPFTPIAPERAEVILQCFLRGFATKTAMLAPDRSYRTIKDKHVVAVHPASVLHGQQKEAIMFLEHVYTAKNYAKKVSAIRAHWIAEAMERRMGDKALGVGSGA